MLAFSLLMLCVHGTALPAAAYLGIGYNLLKGNPDVTRAKHGDPILTPSIWPRGKYGLPKAVSGCPGGGVQWQEGWRDQDAENMLNGPYHLAGRWAHDEDILTEFCMKGDETLKVMKKCEYDWPRGSYCIYKYGDCPTGFQEGAIYWDDSDSRILKVNRKGGYLPDGFYDHDTLIRFCCRNDDDPQSKIYLPTSQPFYLLRQGQSCQLVHDMQVQEEVAQYDEGNLFHDGHTEGAHPHVEDNDNKKLFFCYYTMA